MQRQCCVLMVNTITKERLDSNLDFSFEEERTERKETAAPRFPVVDENAEAIRGTLSSPGFSSLVPEEERVLLF